MSDELADDPAREAALAHARAIDCCGNDAWRGRLCHYHQGYEDGYDAARAGCQRCGTTLTDDDGTSWPYCARCGWCPDCPHE